jgi:hypothetical protein
MTEGRQPGPVGITIPVQVPVPGYEGGPQILEESAGAIPLGDAAVDVKGSGGVQRRMDDSRGRGVGRGMAGASDVPDVGPGIAGIEHEMREEAVVPLGGEEVAQLGFGAIGIPPGERPGHECGIPAALAVGRAGDRRGEPSVPAAIEDLAGGGGRLVECVHRFLRRGGTWYVHAKYGGA